MQKRSIITFIIIFISVIGTLSIHGTMHVRELPPDVNGFTQQLQNFFSYDKALLILLWTWLATIKNNFITIYLLLFFSYLIIFFGYRILSSKAKLVEKSIIYGYVLFFYYSLITILFPINGCFMKFLMMTIGEIFIGLCLIVEIIKLVLDPA